MTSLDDLDTSLSTDDDDTESFIKGLNTSVSPAPNVLETVKSAPPAKTSEFPPPVDSEDDGDDPSLFMETLGLSRDVSVADIRKPWMENHQFVLVSTIEQLRGIVDQALKHGRMALDLETQGLDSRIDWKDGKPETRHKIVGYCLSVDGKVGYYVPVRHKPSESVNLPNDEVEEEIRRLCLASQPKLTEEGLKKDPLSSAMIAEKPQVIIYFWNAKFDQEFLFPVCGIDWWHPDSFEDGYLLYYCRYSNDKNLGLKAKSRDLLNTTLEVEQARKWWPHDYPEGKPQLWKSKQVPYEMIELKELFIQGRKGIHFDQLTPEEGLYYACSDAICTYLLCDGDEMQKSIKDKRYASTYRLEKQVSEVVRVVERNRVKTDKPYVIELLGEAAAEAKGYETEILDIARARGYPDLDVRSSKKLSEFLFSEKWMDITPKPERNEASGQYKTDADTLESLYERNADNTILGKLVKFRQIDKVIGTYLESLRDNCDEHDQIRVQFKQTGAPTGRFSAPAGQPEHGYGGVPIHGIPATYDDKKPKVATSLRKIFIARPGYTMVKVDYAAEELRVVTNLSKEPVWIKEFTEGTGDLHSITARAFFNKAEVTKQERQQGKCVHPDTLVHTGLGFKTIRQIGPIGSPDTFTNLPEGTKVFNGDIDVPVTATYNGGIKKLIHVVARKGVVTCTPEHRFQLITGELRRAGDLTLGDLLANPSTGSLPYVDYYELQRMKIWGGVQESLYKLSDNHSYFAGIYLGDGFHQEWQETLVTLCDLIGLQPVSEIDSPTWVRYLQELGLLDREQKRLRVPEWVMAADQSAVMSFLGGLMDTGGSVSKESNLEFTTKDFVFAGQLATVCRAANLEFSLEPTFNKTYEHYYVRFLFTTDSSLKFKPYMRHAGKIEKLRTEEHCGLQIKTNEVLHILPAGLGPCLDISVGTEQHLYSANGFVTHNTANFALVYGGGAQAIVRATGCSEQEGARRKSCFDKSVPTFTKWIKQQHMKVAADKGVTTAFGRWMAIPEIDSEDRMIQSAAKRFAINYPVQGCLYGCSVVTTNMGLYSIENLASNKPKGAKIWTGSRWSSFKALNMGPWQLAEIRLDDGTLVKCDTRHKMIKVTDIGYEWVDFESLQEGDKIATPLAQSIEFPARDLPTPSIYSNSPTWTIPSDTSELWYWIGRYYGDGCLSSRGTNDLNYAFGSHEGEDILRASSFFVSCGLNPRVRVADKTLRSGTYSIVYVLTVENKSFKEWLGKLGVVLANAHTKRLSGRIFAETLEHRKSFMRGFMDSDGHRPKDGNPYNIHLCQRQLLADTKLLLRTIGIESRLLGPYQHTNKYDETFASYRLDVQSRSFSTLVDGVKGLRRPKFTDAFAPNFIKKEFLEACKGKVNPKTAGHSSTVLYSRVKNGGDISVYTLKDICDQVGVKIDSPIYSYKRVVKKEVLPEVEDTYTLMVHDDEHRYEAEGVLHKNTGSDIMKISMVMLHKEFFRRGWVQSQDVRMLLTVHDEIVFEVRDQMMNDIVPVIVDGMTAPGRMARDWPIKLIVEPLIGKTWDASVNWELIHHGEKKPQKEGEKLKSYEIRVGDKIYHKVPEWLEAFVCPEWTGKVPTKSEPNQIPSGSSPPPAIATPSSTSSSKSQSVAPQGAVLKREIFVRPIAILTRNTIKTVRLGIVDCEDEAKGHILHVVDAYGNTLVDPSLNILVNPEAFSKYLRERNL